jgi:GntR family transcriptional regulator
LTTVHHNRFGLHAAGHDHAMSGDMSIDPGAATPLWRQLADILRSRIESDEYQPGRIMPSETTLGQEYGLARGTVTKALNWLEDQGLVTRVQGRGTFVAERKG